MNGLKNKKIKVSQNYSLWLAGEDFQGREVEAVILTTGAAVVAKGDSYAWIDSSNYHVIAEIEEFSAKGGVSLVGLLGARPRTLNIDFGG